MDWQSLSAHLIEAEQQAVLGHQEQARGALLCACVVFVRNCAAVSKWKVWDLWSLLAVAPSVVRVARLVNFGCGGPSGFAKPGGGLV